ncbi:MAG TPA: glycosyltransferase [Burkholderiales bacterium]|nr:glycosyltransferase [Burkholderiales bacterium]
MKIFVAGPDHGDFFTHNVAVTCKTMGHDVRPFHGFRPAGSLGRVGRVIESVRERVRASQLRLDRAVLDAAAAFRPNLTIVCTRTLEPDTVRMIRSRTGSAVVCWFGDAPSNIRRDHVVSGEYDAVFLKDRRYADDLRDVLGLNAHHLHEACNPMWHRPNTDERAGHVAVAGTLYGYRAAVLRRLVAAGWEVRCFGPAPSAWIDPEIAKLHTGEFLDHTRKAQEFGRALACLNTFAPAERDTLNCRVFETCGCGGLLVSEHKAAMDDCFTENEEYLAFRSFEELDEHLGRIRRDPAFAERIRANAARRAHSEHTYRQRLGYILETIGS